MQKNYDNSAVIFEEETFKSRRLLGEHTQPFMLRVMMKTGWFRSERQAGLTLLGLVLLFMLISILIIKFVIFPTIPESTPLEDLSFIETTQIDPVLLDALLEIE
jgi:hypothetical protein